MNLKKFYKNIKKKKIKYFFGSKDIYLELSKNYRKYFYNSNILDLGCGDQKNFYIYKKLNFKSYTGVDWIDHRFKKIREKKFFFIKDNILNFLKKNKKKYDLIISIGTLEHFENPWDIVLNIKKRLNKKGKVIFAYPNYYNPRGLVLLTLMHLVNKKISLSDRYFFKPEELKKKLIQMRFKKVFIKSIRQEGGYKKLAKRDLAQRLPKVLNRKFHKNINDFLGVFETYNKYYEPNKFSGQIIIVKAEN